MSNIIIPEKSAIHDCFTSLLDSAKVVFFVGLPGVGKSLLLQQLALMAQDAGRDVHLLQWDVTRSAFETPENLAKYPEIDGVTHAMIRKATGLWAREGILAWSQQADDNALLIGEVPLVGNRLIEPVQSLDDDAEILLRDACCHYVLPVPSKNVRDTIEQKRQQSIADPQHEKETKDAPPNVLRALWEEIHHLGVQNDITATSDTDANLAYNPEMYEAVYRYLLQHCQMTVLHIDDVLTPGASVYDLNGIDNNLKATPGQVTAIMQHLEATYTPDEVEQMVNNWYKI